MAAFGVVSPRFPFKALTRRDRGWTTGLGAFGRSMGACREAKEGGGDGSGERTGGDGAAGVSGVRARRSPAGAAVVGVKGSMTLPAKRLASLAGSQSSCPRADMLLRELSGLNFGAKRIERVMWTVGDDLEAWRSAAEAPNGVSLAREASKPGRKPCRTNWRRRAARRGMSRRASTTARSGSGGCSTTGSGRGEDRRPLPRGGISVGGGAWPPRRPRQGVGEEAMCADRGGPPRRGAGRPPQARRRRGMRTGS